MATPPLPKRASSAKAPPRQPAGPPADEQAGIPTADDIRHAQEELKNFLEAAPFIRFRQFASRLAAKPPQVVLFEGGTTHERRLAAAYWTLLLNCPHVTKQSDKDLRPCLVCQECVRLLTHQHRDLFFLDGSAGTIKIDEVRELRTVLGEPPREARFRLVIFHEGQSLMEAAANALLKSLEDPRKGTSFVLLAPQRERLLATLVSRSICLTLPWPSKRQEEDSLIKWEAALCTFFQTGTGLFALTGTKGEVTPTLVLDIIQLCSRALAARILAEQTGAPLQEGLERALSNIPYARLRIVDEVLAESQDSLIYTVNPTLVLEWLATRLHLLTPR